VRAKRGVADWLSVAGGGEHGDGTGERGTAVEVMNPERLTFFSDAGLTLLALFQHARRDRLLAADTPPGLSSRMGRSVFVSVPPFALSIPVAFVDTSAAKWLWLGGSVAMALALRGYDLVRRRRSAGTAR
jgi:hypothetical protein